MTERIRVGIVGAGANTVARHIPGLLAIEGVEIVSVCNRSEESSRRVAQQFGIPRIYRTWQELVAASDIDAVVIGTWPYLHHPITEAALEADKHVLCEARMAMNAREAHAMLRAARARPHLTTQLVPAPDMLGVHATLKRLLVEGFLGDVLAINVRSGNAFLDKSASLHWRQNFDLVGYNYLSLGIWYESIMRLVGLATKVIAKGKTFVKMRRDDQGFLRAVQIPEHLDLIAEMSCGAQAHFQISKVTGLAGESDVTFFGSAGTVKVKGDRLYGARLGDKELNEIDIPDAEEGSWRVEEEFIAAIRQQGQVLLTSFEDGVNYMEFTEAAAQSMLLGREMILPLMNVGQILP